MPLLSSYPDRVLTRVLGHDSGNLVGKAQIRELLTTTRTYYVRTDGNDSNTGLVDSAGGAFLTLQAAYNLICSTLDQAGFTVTIQVRDGTYAAGLNATAAANGPIIIQGNVVTRANVVFSTGGSDAFRLSVANAYRVSIRSLKITTTGGYGLNGFVNNSIMGFSDIEFGSVSAGNHIYCVGGAAIYCEGDYVITGAAGVHLYCLDQSYIQFVTPTVTLTGTPAFTFFVYCQYQAEVSAFSVTYIGSATGTRYNAGNLALINSFGGGANYFPGSSPGTPPPGSPDLTTLGLYA